MLSENIGTHEAQPLLHCCSGLFVKSKYTTFSFTPNENINSFVNRVLGPHSITKINCLSKDIPNLHQRLIFVITQTHSMHTCNCLWSQYQIQMSARTCIYMCPCLYFDHRTCMLHQKSHSCQDWIRLVCNINMREHNFKNMLVDTNECVLNNSLILQLHTTSFAQASTATTGPIYTNHENW